MAMTHQGKVFYLVMKYRKWRNGCVTELAMKFMATGKVDPLLTDFRDESKLKEWFNKTKKGETWG